MATQVSSRYARAIFDLKDDAKKRTEIHEELAAVAGWAQESADLRSVFSSGNFSAEDAVAVIAELSKKAQLSDDTRRTLNVLAHARRLGQLAGIAETLKQFILEANEVVLLKVASREELDTEERKQIEKKFEDVLKKDVESVYTVDPKVIGGIRVTAEGRTYDGTLVTRLNKMKETLAGGI